MHIKIIVLSFFIITSNLLSQEYSSIDSCIEDSRNKLQISIEQEYKNGELEQLETDKCLSENSWLDWRDEISNCSISGTASTSGLTSSLSCWYISNIDNNQGEQIADNNLITIDNSQYISNLNEINLSSTYNYTDTYDVEVSVTDYDEDGTAIGSHIETITVADKKTGTINYSGGLVIDNSSGDNWNTADAYFRRTSGAPSTAPEGHSYSPNPISIYNASPSYFKFDNLSSFSNQSSTLLNYCENMQNETDNEINNQILTEEEMRANCIHIMEGSDNPEATNINYEGIINNKKIDYMLKYAIALGYRQLPIVLDENKNISSFLINGKMGTHSAFLEGGNLSFNGFLLDNDNITNSFPLNAYQILERESEELAIETAKAVSSCEVFTFKHNHGGYDGHNLSVPFPPGVPIPFDGHSGIYFSTLFNGKTIGQLKEEGWVDNYGHFGFDMIYDTGNYGAGGFTVNYGSLLGGESVKTYLGGGRKSCSVSGGVGTNAVFECYFPNAEDSNLGSVLSHSCDDHCYVTKPGCLFSNLSYDNNRNYSAIQAKGLQSILSLLKGIVETQTELDLKLQSELSEEEYNKRLSTNLTSISPSEFSSLVVKAKTGSMQACEELNKYGDICEDNQLIIPKDITFELYQKPVSYEVHDAIGWNGVTEQQICTNQFPGSTYLQRDSGNDLCVFFNEESCAKGTTPFELTDTRENHTIRTYKPADNNWTELPVEETGDTNTHYTGNFVIANSDSGKNEYYINNVLTTTPPTTIRIGRELNSYFYNYFALESQGVNNVCNDGDAIDPTSGLCVENSIIVETTITNVCKAKSWVFNLFKDYESTTNSNDKWHILNLNPDKTVPDKIVSKPVYSESFNPVFKECTSNLENNNPFTLNSSDINNSFYIFSTEQNLEGSLEQIKSLEKSSLKDLFLDKLSNLYNNETTLSTKLDGFLENALTFNLNVIKNGETSFDNSVITFSLDHEDLKLNNLTSSQLINFANIDNSNEEYEQEPMPDMTYCSKSSLSGNVEFPNLNEYIHLTKEEFESILESDPKFGMDEEGFNTNLIKINFFKYSDIKAYNYGDNCVIDSSHFSNTENYNNALFSYSNIIENKTIPDLINDSGTTTYNSIFIKPVSFGDAEETGLSYQLNSDINNLESEKILQVDSSNQEICSSLFSFDSDLEFQARARINLFKELLADLTDIGNSDLTSSGANIRQNIVDSLVGSGRETIEVKTGKQRTKWKVFGYSCIPGSASSWLSGVQVGSYANLTPSALNTYIRNIRSGKYASILNEETLSTETQSINLPAISFYTIDQVSPTDGSKVQTKNSLSGFPCFKKFNARFKTKYFMIAELRKMIEEAMILNIKGLLDEVKYKEFLNCKNSLNNNGKFFIEMTKKELYNFSFIENNLASFLNNNNWESSISSSSNSESITFSPISTLDPETIKDICKPLSLTIRDSSKSNAEETLIFTPRIPETCDRGLYNPDTEKCEFTLINDSNFSEDFYNRVFGLIGGKFEFSSKYSGNLNSDLFNSNSNYVQAKLCANGVRVNTNEYIDETGATVYNGELVCNGGTLVAPKEVLRKFIDIAINQRTTESGFNEILVTEFINLKDMITDNSAGNDKTLGGDFLGELGAAGLYTDKSLEEEAYNDCIKFKDEKEEVTLNPPEISIDGSLIYSKLVFKNNQKDFRFSYEDSNGEVIIVTSCDQITPITEDKLTTTDKNLTCDSEIVQTSNRRLISEEKDEEFYGTTSLNNKNKAIIEGDYNNANIGKDLDKLAGIQEVGGQQEINDDGSLSVTIGGNQRGNQLELNHSSLETSGFSSSDVSNISYSRSSSNTGAVDSNEEVIEQDETLSDSHSMVSTKNQMASFVNDSNSDINNKSGLNHSKISNQSDSGIVEKQLGINRNTIVNKDAEDSSFNVDSVYNSFKDSEKTNLKNNFSENVAIDDTLNTKCPTCNTEEQRNLDRNLDKEEAQNKINDSINEVNTILDEESQFTSNKSYSTSDNDFDEIYNEDTGEYEYKRKSIDDRLDNINSNTDSKNTELNLDSSTSEGAANIEVKNSISQITGFEAGGNYGIVEINPDEEVVNSNEVNLFKNVINSSESNNAIDNDNVDKYQNDVLQYFNSMK